MASGGIHLVMPKVVKESYDDLIQGETMTFSRFIEEIQGLQASRPQSLTLL
ncbi:restriction endonuclease [Bifidobacterium breve]|nr:restriction endonuclease [Bifidobacterium breve]